MATRNRILEKARELFNERGTAEISTNTLAAECKLSVSNLYYYFQNKEDIVRALYERIMEDSSAEIGLSPNEEPTYESLEAVLRANHRILWKYRFFYREMSSLLHRDPELAILYRQYRAHAMLATSALIQKFAKANIIAPVNEESASDLAFLCWQISETYLPYAEASGAEVSETTLDGAILMIRYVVRPTEAR